MEGRWNKVTLPEPKIRMIVSIHETQQALDFLHVRKCKNNASHELVYFYIEQFCAGLQRTNIHKCSLKE